MARTLPVACCFAFAVASCSGSATKDGQGASGAPSETGGAPNLGGAPSAGTTSGGADTTSGGAPITSGGAPITSGGSNSGGADITSGGSGSGGASATTGGSSTGASTSSGGAGGAGTSASGGGGSAGTPGTAVETPLPALRTVRQEHGVAALGGEIYVVGGYTPSVTATVEAFDPQKMTWRAVKDFPTTFQHPNVGVAAGKLFVLGFYIGGDMTAATDQAFAYDPSANTWSAVASLPAGTERAASCTAVLGNDIYVFGGGRRGASVRDASVYDAEGNSWRELPPMPSAREHCVAGAINGKLYIVGGRANSIIGFEPTSLEFDPASPGYVQKKPIPTPRGGIAGGVLGAELFVFGGEGNSAGASGVFNNIDSYDPASDSWRAHPPMKTPRHGFGAATLNEHIYLMGGARNQGAGAVNNASVFSF